MRPEKQPVYHRSDRRHVRGKIRLDAIRQLKVRYRNRPRHG